MACSYSKCTVRSEREPFVSCWLCHYIIHAKCAELNSRVADNLNEDKGLRWCCKKCKVYDLQFYQFFRNTRSNFEDIIHHLALLSEKLNNHKEVFDNAPSLDQFINQPIDLSPKRKKTLEAASKLISNNPLLTLPGSSTSNHNANLILTAPQTSHLVPPTLTSGAASDAINTESNTTTTHSSANAQKVNVIPLTTHLSSSTLSITPSTSTSAINRNSFFSPINSPFEPNPTQNNLTQISVNQNGPITPKPLQIVPSNRAIFAARFAADTTVEDMSYYIKSKFNSDFDLTVIKFKYAEQRTKSSFKIIVPDELFEQIVNPDFWPPKAIIHEYTYRNNGSSNIARLPRQSESESKN